MQERFFLKIPVNPIPLLFHVVPQGFVVELITMIDCHMHAHETIFPVFSTDFLEYSELG